MKNKVILPVTEDKQCSYVETIARKPQVANWFVSHWWGEPVEEFIQCLEQHAEDHRLDKKRPFIGFAHMPTINGTLILVIL